MNDKIQAVLLKLVVALQKLHWKVDGDWQLALKTEGHVTMQKHVSVHGSLDDDEWDDQIETTLDLKLGTSDEVTFFPEFMIYAEIFIDGGGIKDVAEKTDNATAFTDHDIQDDAKIGSAAKQIDRAVEDHIEHEYDAYLADNGSDISALKKGGVDPDQYDDVD